MKLKVPETHLEHLQNVRRDLYIKIGIEAREVAFDLHECHMDKLHPDMAEKDEQYEPPEAWMSDYYPKAKHTKGLIHKLFSIPFCQDSKLEAQTKSWIDKKNWLAVADKYDYLQAHTDAPIAHWAWRNRHEHPHKLAPETKDIMRVRSDIDKLALKHGYRVDRFKAGHNTCIEFVDIKRNQAVDFSKLPKDVRTKIEAYLNYANYLAERE